MRRLGMVLLELLWLLVGMVTGGPGAAGIRVVAVILAAMVGAVIVFSAVVLALGVVAQRQPPYPM